MKDTIRAESCPFWIDLLCSSFFISDGVVLVVWRAEGEDEGKNQTKTSMCATKA